MVKNFLLMQETGVRSLCWEDALEKEMATHSSILAWGIPWMEELGGLVHGVAKVSDTTEQRSTHTTSAQMPRYNAPHKPKEYCIKRKSQLELTVEKLI